MLPGSRVLTASDFEQQRESYRDVTAICLWCVQLVTGCTLSFLPRACMARDRATVAPSSCCESLGLHPYPLASASVSSMCLAPSNVNMYKVQRGFCLLCVVAPAALWAIGLASLTSKALLSTPCLVPARHVSCPCSTVGYRSSQYTCQSLPSAPCLMPACCRCLLSLLALFACCPCSTVGYRSSQYAAALMDKGHKAVNLQGGILAWVSTNLGPA
jgi:hypothetical protein